HPPSTLYELRKLVARHRLPVLIALAGILGVGALAITSSVLAFRLVSREDDLQHALDHAVQSQRHAEQEAGKSEANTEFLVHMFDSREDAVIAGQARPERTMLAQARARLESGELAAQPALEVTLWRRLAYTGTRLGMHVEAEAACERAMTLCRERFGPDDEE